MSLYTVERLRECLSAKFGIVDDSRGATGS
jgi:hypothetical protein